MDTTTFMFRWSQRLRMIVVAGELLMCNFVSMSSWDLKSEVARSCIHAEFVGKTIARSLGHSDELSAVGSRKQSLSDVSHPP